MMMIKLSNLDAAVVQALLIVSAARERSSSSTATCDAIIGAMCRAGRYREAFEYFHQGRVDEALRFYRVCSSLLRKRFVMNAITGNILLRILLNYDRKTEAWALFDRMLEDHQFNADTCNVMVNECFENSRFNEAVNTFKRVGTNINGSQLCYRNIISRFCEHGKLSEAGAFFEEMCSKQFIVPDIPTYRIFLDAYANASRFDDAERMANLTVLSLR